MIATISADIVRSTSLQTEDLITMRNKLRLFLDKLEENYPGFWARIVRGDSIECVVPEFRYSLRIAILIKLFVKVQAEGVHCHELLRQHGIRYSIGLGDLNFADKGEDIINGPAIYLSGRNLDDIGRKDLYTAIEMDKTLMSFNNLLGSYVAMVGNLVDSYSAKQAEVVFHKLQGLKEVEISERLGITQSSVNIRSRSAQWGLLNTAIKDYEELDFEKICG